jgi:prevent-host-death family protein
MITSLKEAKSKLSELVEVASGGEEVIITVHGKAKARLCRVVDVSGADSIASWASQLEEARARYRTSKVGGDDDAQKFWDELRKDR